MKSAGISEMNSKGNPRSYRLEAIGHLAELKKALKGVAFYNPKMRCLRCGICCELESPYMYGKPCRYLEKDAQELASCSIFDLSQRPIVCNVFGVPNFDVCPIGEVYWGLKKSGGGDANDSR